MFPDKHYSYAMEPGRDDSLLIHTPEEKEYLLKRMAKIGKDYTDRYMQNNWIEEDGFSGWRWERYNVQRWIVSAANRYKDIIIMGTRHSSPTMYMTTLAYGGFMLLHEYSGDDHSQGFVDQFGTYYEREEALKLAEENGQIRNPDGNTPTELFSEGLY